jgi:hypothetical protein
VDNGATLQAANLTIQAAGIAVDAGSSVEVGTAGDIATGDLVIDLGEIVTAAISFVFGDFGGSFTDLVYQRQSDDLVEIQYLNGNTALGGGVISNNPPFGPGWQVVGVATSAATEGQTSFIATTLPVRRRYSS